MKRTQDTITLPIYRGFSAVLACRTRMRAEIDLASANWISLERMPTMRFLGL